MEFRGKRRQSTAVVPADWVRIQQQQRSTLPKRVVIFPIRPVFSPPATPRKGLVQLESEVVDCVVIGAGVVGIAVARALAMSGREVIVVDAAEGIGTQTSSRNSEVIHAGIYYPQGSLMARLCVQGRRKLYSYCSERGVPVQNCGKLIVATSKEESAKLPAILARAQANDVEGMRLLTASEARALEPNLACTSALLSSTTGIVDSHAYMLALQSDAQSHGATFVFHTPVMGGQANGDGVEIVAGVEAPLSLRCRLLVNSAGLQAPAVANSIKGLPSRFVPTPFYAKGTYFILKGRSPFSMLIYPVPVPGGLGVHLTLDTGGQAKFGPDVQWIDTIDYSVDPARAENFYRAVRRYWPDLKDGALLPGYSGIRPKLGPAENPSHDFVVQGRDVHGVTGLINLFGIESPGLTAAISIGDFVCRLANSMR